MSQKCRINALTSEGVLEVYRTSRQPAVKEVPDVPVAKKSEAATTPEPEEAFAKYVAGLKPEVREQIKTAMTKTHPKPTWTEFHATNLKEAPAGF